LECFTFGGVIDLLNAYIEEQERIIDERENGKEKVADQADIDKMFS